MDRPRPPSHLADPNRLPPTFLPAPEVWEWIQRTILAETGALYNVDHAHLCYAEIGVLWTNVECRKGMMAVAGKAETAFMHQGDDWTKERYQQQLGQWFPDAADGLDFVITMDAVWAEAMDDVSWCALVEHELYHCAQLVSKRGELLFTEDDVPRFGIRRHDVEQFVGVMARYGPQTEEERAFVRAANAGPLIAPARIGLACGTCNRMVA